MDPEQHIPDSQEPAPEVDKGHIDLQRERLPDTRQSVVHKFSIQGTEGYLIVGLYNDGRPGEVFLKVAKEGSTLGGLMDGIGVLTSLGLQYGVPLEVMARKLQNTQFEPSGLTKNRDIAETSSILDYIFRWLEQHFAGEARATLAMKLGGDSVEEWGEVP